MAIPPKTSLFFSCANLHVVKSLGRDGPTGGVSNFLETAKSEQDEGFRNIHFKMADMRLAKQEMQQRGIRMLAEHRIGGVWEVVYDPAELHGIRLCLVE